MEYILPRLSRLLCGSGFPVIFVNFFKTASFYILAVSSMIDLHFIQGLGLYILISWDWFTFFGWIAELFRCCIFVKLVLIYFLFFYLFLFF